MNKEAMQKRRMKFDWHEPGCKCDSCFFLRHIDALEKEKKDTELKIEGLKLDLEISECEHEITYALIEPVLRVFKASKGSHSIHPAHPPMPMWMKVEIPARYLDALARGMGKAEEKK